MNAMKKFSLVLGVFVAIALWYQMVKDPVPFSFACMTLDRDMRAYCHYQTSIVKTRLELQNLIVFGDPLLLRTNRDKIVQEYERFLDNGVNPSEIGMSPEQLGMAIDSIVSESFGDPI